MAWTAHASSATREGGLRRRTSSCSSRIGAGRAREASPFPSSPFDFECCSFVFLKEIKPEHGGVYFLSAKGTLPTLRTPGAVGYLNTSWWRKFSPNCSVTEEQEEREQEECVVD